MFFLLFNGFFVIFSNSPTRKSALANCELVRISKIGCESASSRMRVRIAPIPTREGGDACFGLDKIVPRAHCCKAVGQALAQGGGTREISGDGRGRGK